MKDDENVLSFRSNYPSGEPIAPKLGIHYPFSRHLRYAYPPPDTTVLSNISNALAAIPQFYTQVIHLMNKMNLPPPFAPACPPRVQVPEPSSTHLAKVNPKRESENINEQEEEEEDEVEGEGVQEQRPQKRIKTTEGNEPPVVVKLPGVIKKKQPMIEIKVKKRALPVSERATRALSDSAGPLKGSAEPKSPENAQQREVVLSRGEIVGGKLSLEQLKDIPAFNNYSAGTASNVLYIKNLSKGVEENQLWSIFSSFHTEVEIKLMKEGRMKGQAFVTFPSEDSAKQALECCNGYLLKDKPMVIQYGRKSRQAPENIN